MGVEEREEEGDEERGVVVAIGRVGSGVVCCCEVSAEVGPGSANSTAIRRL